MIYPLRNTPGLIWLVIVICAGLACVPGCRSRPEPVGFNLAAVTLPGDFYYQIPLYSEVPGVLSTLALDRIPGGGRFDKGYAAVRIAADGTVVQELIVEKAPQSYNPVLYLPGGGALMFSRRKDPDGRHTSDLVLVDDTGNQQQLVPDCEELFGTSMPPARLYSTGDGLIVIESDSGSGYTISRLGEELTALDTVADVAGSGFGFYHGALSMAFVLADGRVLVFDRERGRTVADPDYQWLAGLIAISDGMARPGIVVDFTFANGVAAVDLDEYVQLMNARGDEYRIECWNAVEYSPRGIRRSPATIEKGTQDRLFYREEGRTVGTGMAGSTCYLRPLDDSRLCLVDKVYQRLVIIEEASSEVLR